VHEYVLQLAPATAEKFEREYKMATLNQPDETPQEASASRAVPAEAPSPSTMRNMAAQVERSVGLLALAADLNARNLEMVLSAIGTAMKGVQALSRETLAQSDRASQQAAQTLRVLGGVRSTQDLLSAQIEYFKANGESLLEQSMRIQATVEDTRKALVDDCSSRLQESLLGYLRVVRG
jgi:hypothetical protein